MTRHPSQFSIWLWPVILALSSGSMLVLMFLNVDSPVRTIMAFWFMGFCPGMAFIGALRLKDVLARVTLAIALSIALDILVSELIVYSGTYSPQAGLFILLILTLAGAGIQVVQIALNKTQPEGVTAQHVDHQ